MNPVTKRLKRCRPRGRPLRGFAADLVTGQVPEPVRGLRAAAARWLIRKMPSPHPAAPWHRVRTAGRPACPSFHLLDHAALLTTEGTLDLLAWLAWLRPPVTVTRADA